MPKSLRIVFVLVSALGTFTSIGFAQERPYFVTYDHHMEEPGSLEVATNPVIGRSPSMNSFIGNWTEFEYGAKGWWTSEFYVDSQHTRHDSSLVTGFALKIASGYCSASMRSTPCFTSNTSTSIKPTRP